MRPFAEEHVLRSAQADPPRAERKRDLGLIRLIGVRPHLHPAERVGPVENLRETAIDVGFLRREVPGHDLQNLARFRCHLRELHFAREAVEGHEISLSNGLSAHGELLQTFIDLELGRTDDRRLAHLASDDGGV